MIEKKPNKYRNRKVTDFEGQTHGSVHEYNRWCELQLMQKAGLITNLKRQVPFELIPAQYETFERYGKRGQRLNDGRRMLEHAVVYIADFVYTNNTGEVVVEDTKSEATRTKDYIIKRKLMLYVHGIRVQEI